MRYLILSFFLVACANNQQVIDSSLSTVKTKNTGALLTVDLKTEGRIKRGQSCKLIINQNNISYKLSLNEGTYNYALPLQEGTAKLQELNCGPFYYYKLVDQGTYFDIKNGEITYLGTIDFHLENEGQMTWGPSTKSNSLLKANLGQMGLSTEKVMIQPLSL